MRQPQLWGAMEKNSYLSVHAVNEDGEVDEAA
jgi:hypothetical protein